MSFYHYIAMMLLKSGVFGQFDFESRFMPDLDALSKDELVALVSQLVERVTFLEAEVAWLRAQLPGGGAGAPATLPPAWIKPNQPKAERKQRRKRSIAFVRRRQAPDEIVVHALERCPDCGHHLREGWEHALREVIDIPPVSVRVVHHRIMRHRCGVCGKQHVASADLSGHVIGRHRFGCA